jgi:drug/metabolite transporter (DMT)-like permease
MIERAGPGIAFALAAASFYALVPNLARVAFEHGVPGVESTLARTSLVALALCALARLLGMELRIPAAARPAFLLQALATATVSIAYLWSVEYIPVGLAVLVFFTFPVLVLIASPLVEGHPPGLFRIAVALLAFAGLAIAIGPGFEGLDWRGLCLAGLAALGVTLQSFSGRALSRHLPSAVFGGLAHLAIWPVTLLVALWWGGGSLAVFSSAGVGYAGLMAASGLACSYLVAYFFHMQSLRNAPASIVAPFFNLEPVVTTALAALLLGERLASHQYAGALLILAALLAAGFAGRFQVPARRPSVS